MKSPAARDPSDTNSADSNAAINTLASHKQASLGPADNESANACPSHRPAKRKPTSGDSANGGCCSTVEQVWLMKGGKRMEHADEQGWRISEVERLTGLSRRDIQRCCYEGKGGVGILQPANSSWGRRTYSKRDLATLFVVASYRRRGFTLPQVKEVFEKHEGEKGLRALLDEECERASDQLEAILGQLLRAKALRASLEKDPSDRLSQLFRNVATVHLVLFPSSNSLEALLAIPGMDLLVELWLGPDALR